MTWPLSQDFNEAVQNPGTAFADPDLKGGRAAASPLGVPLPRSGNYADVYQLTAADGRVWAVKCFTRPTAAGMADRYAAIADCLNLAALPFTVGFDYQPEGVRVRGRWYPVVKMPWVDGFPLNAFVRDNLDRPAVLEALLAVWVRLGQRLRGAGIAHGDLQHGNVLLVPADGRAGTLGLRLVDYDGLFVPPLAGNPPGEIGHANYQHPGRAAANAYSADLDRFPLLVVATALRGLMAGGRGLWDRYDTGDNLLFTEKDFQAPCRSKLVQELRDLGDPITDELLAHLVRSCDAPLSQTPWLDELVPDGRPPQTAPPGTAGVPPAHPRPAGTVLGWEEGSARRQSSGRDARGPRGGDLRPARPNRTALLAALAAGVLTFAAIVAGTVLLVGNGEPAAEVRTDPTGETEPTPIEPSESAEPPPAAPVVALVAAPVAFAPGSPEPSRRLLSSGLLAALAAVGDAATRGPPPKPPVPPPDAVAAAGVRDVYRDDFARTLPKDQRALAEKLLADADRARADPPGRYARLREALAVAAGLHHPSLALRAVAGLEESFAVDGPAERVAALEAVAGTTHTVALRAAADAALEQADAMADRDEFAAAVRLAGLAAACLRTAGPGAAARDADARQVQLRKLAEAFEPVRAALGVLKTTPLDPAAHLAVGRFRCFVQGRWDDGLPHLANGSDAALRALGRLEMDDVSDGRRADGWWEYAAELPEADRGPALARAKFWYGAVFTDRTDGPDRARAADRLGFTANRVEYRPGLITEVSIPGQRRRQIDPAIDGRTPDFVLPAGRSRVTVKWTGVLVPPEAGRYRLIADTTDPVKVTIGPRGEERVLIDSKGGIKPEVAVVLTDQPRAVTITYSGPTTPNRTFALRWVRPGAHAPEPVPAAALFHRKSDEGLLSER